MYLLGPAHHVVQHVQPDRQQVQIAELTAERRHLCRDGTEGSDQALHLAPATALHDARPIFSTRNSQTKKDEEEQEGDEEEDNAGDAHDGYSE